MFAVLFHLHTCQCTRSMWFHNCRNTLSCYVTENMQTHWRHTCRQTTNNTGRHCDMAPLSARQEAHSHKPQHTEGPIHSSHTCTDKQRHTLQIKWFSGAWGHVCICFSQSQILWCLCVTQCVCVSFSLSRLSRDLADFTPCRFGGTFRYCW